MIESHYFEVPRNSSLTGSVTSSNVFSSPGNLDEAQITSGGKVYTYIKWGNDNQMPYEIKKHIEKNSVMAQNKFFNTLTCYGRGLEYMDVATMGSKQPSPTQDSEIRMWLLRNNLKIFFAEQIVDIKYYFFSVAVVILNVNRDKIVRVIHKDACHCRFTKANDKGCIENVLYGDWEDNASPDGVEVIPLLDEQDPYGDLWARVGKGDSWGEFKPAPKNQRKFAIVCRMPGVGNMYYQTPPYTAVWRDGWYDLYGILTKAKIAKIKNSMVIRYHIEINTEFWEVRARRMNISPGTEEFEGMKARFIDEIKQLLSGSDNTDKVLWSEFEQLMNSQEKHYVKINTVDTKKVGNEFNDDVAEVSNMLCYDDNVHPNLAGATPGKSQMNNSGSDKRELFTMKQALETLPHDVMMTVHNTIIFFNGWDKMVTPVVPMILLTTLDQNTDAKETNMSNTPNSSEDGNTGDNN